MLMVILIIVMITRMTTIIINLIINLMSKFHIKVILTLMYSFPVNQRQQILFARKDWWFSLIKKLSFPLLNWNFPSEQQTLCEKIQDFSPTTYTRVTASSQPESWIWDG